MKCRRPFVSVLIMPFALLGVLWGTAGCDSSVSGRVDAQGRLELKLHAALTPKMSALVRSLSPANSAAPLLPAHELSRSISAIEGVTQAELKQRGPAEVEGQVSVRAVNALLPPQDAEDFLSWRQNAAGGSARLYISRANGPALTAALSPDLADYLSTLMAPLATGETLTKQEYLELVGSVYGKDIAGEIAGARFKLSLSFPQELRSVTGGSRSGNTAAFNLPLLDILVLENPFVCEMSWGKL